MTILQSNGTAAEWGGPALLRPRGTVVVLAGRGETTSTYQRFGRRLHADAYRVLVYGDAAGDVDRIASELRAAIALDELPRPLVIVGSDLGAVAAVDLSVELGNEVGATILAAYPTSGGSGFHGDRASELLERTSCIVHRGVLDADTGFVDGTLARGLRDDEVRRELSALPGPVLAVHGGADVISPFEGVLPFYESAPEAEIWVVDGSKHDVLNDSTHRTTAALIIQYLERLRSGSPEPIARRVR